jgi:glycosyltransferase involved in cell wall biosynthesis
VLAQSFPDLELIVVVDGPDPETIRVVQSIADRRIRVIHNRTSLASAGARNIGAAAATGRWVAFLDDDDFWMPHKLERQREAAIEYGDHVIVSCLSRIVTPLAEYVWPRQIYDNKLPISEYLFDRRSLTVGEGFFQSSSLFLPLELFRKIQFQKPPHDDWDLVIRAVTQFAAQIHTIPEVLVTHHLECTETQSTRATWQQSLDWAGDRKMLFTRRAYSGFLLVSAGGVAARAREFRAFFPLLWRAFSDGSPTFMHLAVCLGIWVLPRGFRQRVRSRLSGRKNTVITQPGKALSRSDET